MPTEARNEPLSKDQLDISKELIDTTLLEAAASMGKMLKIRVEANNLDFGLGELPRVADFDLLGRFKVHLVKMNFEGDINGAFYFIINDHEVDLINSVCLPEQFKSDNRMENRQMKHGFMSEIENVIAALSIHQLSEFLGAQLQLSAPDINILMGSQVNEYLANENEANQTSFYSRSILEGKVVNITPQFIWMIDHRFIDILRLST
ncbi:MAG: hypothetical protein KI790_08090 [Cyclobacteriaceae bacterium]|nr:hypothetical protein [Cyclobacteriaceae bacterium HetDA_MAG_MS6]